MFSNKIGVEYISNANTEELQLFTSHFLSIFKPEETSLKVHNHTRIKHLM